MIYSGKVHIMVYKAENLVSGVTFKEQSIGAVRFAIGALVGLESSKNCESD